MELLEILSCSIVIIAIFTLFVFLFKLLFENFYLENTCFVAILKTILVFGFIVLFILSVAYLKFRVGEL